VHGLERKNLKQPESVRRFPHGHIDSVSFGESEIGRWEFEPGWRSRGVQSSDLTEHLSTHSGAVDLTSRLEQLLRLEFAHEEELARVAETDTAPSAGAWRAADYLAHFSLWRRLFLDHMRSVLAGTNPSAPPEDLDGVNENQLALDRQLPARELITRWRHGCQGMLDFLQACRGAELERPPEWYGAATVGAAVVRNSYTHPCGHLVDFHFERGRRGTAAGLAEEMADVTNELRDLDFRFPAGTHAFRGLSLALRARPDEAMEALGRAVALRPMLGPMLREEAVLASLRGRADFEAMTSPDATAHE
jgi:hypothetical protein